MAADSPKLGKVLVVDDEPANLQLLHTYLRNDYDLVFARSGADALAAVEKHRPNLILLDVMMPSMDGYEVIRRLRANLEFVNIPVIFVTARGDQEGEEEGFEAGAVDYVTKPVKPGVLMARVRTHLALADQQNAYRQQVREATRQMERSYHEAIHMLGTAGHFNDQDTGIHIWRMGAFAGALARASLWDVDRAATLELAATMHDMGKIGIPDAILRKPGKLDADEWEVMKRHTVLGRDILRKGSSPMFQQAAQIAMYHHERWDGDGYPEGLSGEEIPEAARIVAIADVFDALTMERPYKQAWPVGQAFDTIRGQAGSQLDPNLVELFLGIQDELLALKQEWDRREQEAAGRQDRLPARPPIEPH